jgi:hypothetical protein
MEGCDGGCGIDKIDDCAASCALCEPAYRWDCECCSEANYCFSQTMGATNSCYRTTKQERQAGCAVSDIRDCNDCQYEPGDCLFCSDITKNMFKPKEEFDDDRRNKDYEKKKTGKQETVLAISIVVYFALTFTRQMMNFWTVIKIIVKNTVWTKTKKS